MQSQDSVVNTNGARQEQYWVGSLRILCISSFNTVHFESPRAQCTRQRDSTQWQTSWWRCRAVNTNVCTRAQDHKCGEQERWTPMFAQDHKTTGTHPWSYKVRLLVELLGIFHHTDRIAGTWTTSCQNKTNSTKRSFRCYLPRIFHHTDRIDWTLIKKKCTWGIPYRYIKHRICPQN